MLALTRSQRRHSDAPEVLLGKLRTTAHILDKGLQAEGWATGHGRSEYKTACMYIERLQGSDIRDDPSFIWTLEKKAQYEEAQRSGLVLGQTYEPITARISKEDLLNLVHTRRSARSFEDRPIALETLRELAEVTNWAPSSCNRQSTKLFITQTPDKVTACLRQCAGATCLGKAIPCFVSICADTRLYSCQDRNLPLVDASLGLQNLLLLAHLQGIDGTILNWMHHTTKEALILRSVLDIPDYYLVVANLILGYPTRSAPAPVRKGTDGSFRLTY